MEKDYIEKLRQQLGTSLSKSELKNILQDQFENLKLNIENTDFNSFLEEEKKNLLFNLEKMKNPLFRNSSSTGMGSLLKNITLRENQEVLLSTMQSLNAREYLDLYIEMFDIKNLNDEFKTRLFLILAEQQIDKEMLLRKSFKKFIVNPCKMDIVEKLALLGNLKKSISSRIGFINPGWSNISGIIAENYFLVVFPDWPDSAYARNSLVYAIIECAKDILGVEEEATFNEIEYSEEYVKEFKKFFKAHKILD
ncbi:hypothetical protein [Spiroplasma endosymbiont of Aspidapion aeneum]|uniref:hypothetical protein n=1 Tax=Spiroplasma endosymbiont of Aspidapion aeneum TaxID=3066276 RepID=UPI00313C19A6